MLQHSSLQQQRAGHHPSHNKSFRIVPIISNTGRSARTLLRRRAQTTGVTVLGEVVHATTNQGNIAVEPEAAVAVDAAAASFNWLQNWWPVLPVSYLDPARPTHHTICGIDLAVWGDGRGAWSALSDLCPHRLAPLSQGRLVGGQLVCAYHGWAFDKAGTCTNIPQLPDSPAKPQALRKGCATHFPTRVVDDVLFVWLDPSPQGVALSQAVEPYVPAELVGSPFGWVVNEVQNDFSLWVEQGMDPSHANFLHVGVGGFKSENALPMAPATTVPTVDAKKGFTWLHGGYEKKNAAMSATREFRPPFHIRALYTQESKGKPTTISLNTMTVPVKPGVSRTWFRLAFMPSSTTAPAAAVAPSAQDTSAPSVSSKQGDESTSVAQVRVPSAEDMKKKKGSGGLFALIGKLPHWVAGNAVLGDQDIVMMHIQERLMHRQGNASRKYRLLASGADAGVAAINRWMRAAGYPERLWGAGSGPGPELPLETLLSRQQRHVRMCKVCQDGQVLVGRLATAITALSALAGAWALMLAAVAQVTAGSVAAAGAPLAMAVGIAAGAAVAAKHVWALYEERFISGMSLWKAKGGYSLVPNLVAV